MRRLAGYTAVVMATLTAVLLVWQFRSVAALFLLSLAVSAAVRPLTRPLIRRGWPQPIAVFVPYLAGIALLLVAILLAGQQLLHEFQTLTENVAASYEHLYPQWQAGSGPQQAIAAQLPPPDGVYEMLANPQQGSVTQRLLGVTRGLLGLAGGVLVVLVLSIYWTIDQTRLERLLLSLLPISHRSRARDIWRATERNVGAYLRSEVIQGVTALLVLGLGYWALGLNYPLTLAFLGALLWLIPLVGVLLTIPPVVLAALSGGPGLVLAATLFTMTVLWLLEFFVEPRLFDRRRYSSIFTVLLMLALADPFGVAGLLVAPPLAATLQSLATLLINPAGLRTHASPEQQLDGLQARLAAVRAALSEEGMAAPPEINNLVERLANLVDQAAHLLPDEPSRSAAAGVQQIHS